MLVDQEKDSNVLRHFFVLFIHKESNRTRLQIILNMVDGDVSIFCNYR